MAANKERTFSILSSAFAIFLFWASLYMYVPILPTHARSLGASETQIGLILASYGLTQLFLRLPLGLLSDRLRRKKVFALIGTLLVGASGLGLALSRTPTALFIFRALSGCAATAWVTISVLYNSHFSIEHAVRTAGQLNFLGAIGQILAMSTGGFLADRWGAGAAFWSSLVLSLPVLLAFSIVKDVRTATGPGITMGQFRKAISTPRLLLVSGLSACSQYAMFATSLGFAAVRAQDLGASDAQLGILTTAVQVAKAIPMFLLSVRRRPQDGRTMAVLGLALVTLPLFIFPFLTRFALLVACQAVMGLGIGIAFPVMMGLALQAVEPEARASAMGVFQSIYAIGMTLGPAISGLFARQWGIVGVYMTNGALLVIATAVAAAFLRPRANRARHAEAAP
ncbi:MAG: MFS transporter [Chloroflexi bacterium]|nr:MFS transporter [Chloroflexota bacterium]MBL7201543.1 MFS transporter [Anaerolineae bacterium]